MAVSVMDGVREEIRRTRRERVEMSYGACMSIALAKPSDVTYLEDIAALVGDKEHIELFKRLVYETDVICLHGGMLRVDGDELWERSEETVDARSGDGPELAGEEGWLSAVCDGCDLRFPLLVQIEAAITTIVDGDVVDSRQYKVR